MGLAETQGLLDQLESIAPAAVRTVVPRPIEIARLAAVLRRLLEERVSVRDLKGILEALARFPGDTTDVVALTEHVRAELRRPLSYELTGGDAELSVYLLDRIIEESIRSAITKTSAGRFLALAPAAARDIVRSIVQALDSVADPVVLTEPELRCFVRQLLQAELPRVRVVSHAELLPQIVVKPLGTVSLTV
jgi:type III secretion protein V